MKFLTGCARLVSLTKRKENQEAKKGCVARLGEYFHFYSILCKNSCKQCIHLSDAAFCSAIRTESALFAYVPLNGYLVQKGLNYNIQQNLSTVSHQLKLSKILFSSSLLVHLIKIFHLPCDTDSCHDCISFNIKEIECNLKHIVPVLYVLGQKRNVG